MAFITLVTPQLKKIDGYENIYSVNPLYLIIGKVDRFIEEKNGSRYLVFNSADENKEVLKEYTELWDEIKNEIKTLNGGKEFKYDKDFMTIKFDSNDDLPLNKSLKFPTMTMLVRSVFEEYGKFYPRIYLDECLYEL